MRNEVQKTTRNPKCLQNYFSTKNIQKLSLRLSQYKEVSN